MFVTINQCTTSPCARWRSSVPPQPRLSSSGCGATTRTVTGRERSVDIRVTHLDVPVAIVECARRSARAAQLTSAEVRHRRGVGEAVALEHAVYRMMRGRPAQYPLRASRGRMPDDLGEQRAGLLR